MDRSVNNDKRGPRNMSSSAATGFGLLAFCVAAERGWINHRFVLRERARKILDFYASRSPHEDGWFYHFVDADSGARMWNFELPSIDTALLLCGALTAKQYFADDETA